jgi:hypothetical protein
MPWGTSSAVSTSPATRSPRSHDRRYFRLTATPGTQRTIVRPSASVRACGIANPANVSSWRQHRPRSRSRPGRPTTKHVPVTLTCQALKVQGAAWPSLSFHVGLGLLGGTQPTLAHDEREATGPGPPCGLSASVLRVRLHGCSAHRPRRCIACQPRPLAHPTRIGASSRDPIATATGPDRGSTAGRRSQGSKDGSWGARVTRTAAGRSCSVCARQPWPRCSGSRQRRPIGISKWSEETLIISCR